jgi:hypothetical protein
MFRTWSNRSCYSRRSIHFCPDGYWLQVTGCRLQVQDEHRQPTTRYPRPATRARDPQPVSEPTSPPIARIEHQGRPYIVTCRIGFDGVEYIGRLWFGLEDGSEPPMPDRAGVPGRTRDEVLALAQRFTPQELTVRHRRALAEKRRYLSLRRATDEIIAKIRYLNQLALSMRSGVIDPDGAALEMELTEQQIIEVVKRLKDYAGMEG